MAVIAMTREMGSLGRDVALGLAKSLGVELIQHELVEQVADKMHVRESAVNRFLEGRAGLLERWGINETELSLYTAEEILDVAERGNVLIRGWGATHVLRPVPHVVCVRVCAPMKFRARVLMDRIGLHDEDVAIKEIKHNDAAHARALSHLFHVDWTDPLNYDAVLNAERIPVASCVEVVEQLVGQPQFQETPESRAMLHDLKITAMIRAALRSNKTTSRPSPSFDIDLEPGTGRVTLTGVAFDREFRDEAEKVVLAVPGVTQVTNEVRVLETANIGP